MTDFDARAQALVCLWLFLSGVAAACFYDLLTPLRRRGRMFCAAADLLFCVFCAGTCALSLAAGGADRARPYAALMVFLGLFFWRLTIGRLFRAIFKHFGRKNRAHGEHDTKQDV